MATKQAVASARVLIVDDQTLTRELMIAIVSGLGYEVLSAKSGPEALSLVETQAVDLVILDVVMPGMDGFEVARRLRADPRSHIVPIVMVSGLEDKESKIRGLAEGADDFMARPVDLLEIRIRLQNLVRLKRFQDELAGRNAMLERDVKQRTEELEQALTASNAANAAKSTFLTTMSHELRTPLNGILGMAQLLQLGTVAEGERQGYADTIFESGIGLMALLNDVLDLAKLDAGGVGLCHSPYRPDALIREAIGMFKAAAKAKGLAIHNRAGDLSGRAFQGDPVRIRQMLCCLLSTAVKFTEHGSVAVECTLEAGESPRPALVFSVSDTGIGIQAEKTAEIYSHFNQLDARNTRRQGGAGLGLSMVHHLALLMNGETGVSSRPGVGSRFWFRVPTSIESSEAGATRHEPVAAQTGIAPTFAGRVLIVDDSEANRAVAERMLGRLGLQTVSAANGCEAVYAMCVGPSPDLILMDIQMPEMDGLEATARIREWEQASGTGRVPIVALTAAALDADRDRCIEEGMDGYLCKPVFLKPLASELSKWLPAIG